MTDNIVAILFLLTGVMLAAISYLILTVREMRNKIEDLDNETRETRELRNECWRAVDHLHERVSKMEANRELRPIGGGNNAAD